MSSTHALTVLDALSKLRHKSSAPLSFLRSDRANGTSKGSTCSQLDKFFHCGGNYGPKGRSFLLLKAELLAAEGGRAVGKDF